MDVDRDVMARLAELKKLDLVAYARVVARLNELLEEERKKIVRRSQAET